MCKLLVGVEAVLSGAGIGVDKQDRLGRTILHLAAQFGMKNLTETLLRSQAEGGFGANPLVGDMINQRPIHYAIAHKHEKTFEIHLEHAIKAEQHQVDEQSMLSKLNQVYIPYTLASFCVVKQSWRCLCKLIEKKGLGQLDVKLSLAGFDEATLNKTPQNYASECNLNSEYDLIVAYYELFGANKSKNSNVEENGLSAAEIEKE